MVSILIFMVNVSSRTLWTSSARTIIDIIHTTIYKKKYNQKLITINKYIHIYTRKKKRGYLTIESGNEDSVLFRSGLYFLILRDSKIRNSTQLLALEIMEN